MVFIDKWFGSMGNFKTIYPLLSTIGSVTMLEVDYINDLRWFIIDNFIVFKARDPWMYDPLSLFMETL